MDLFDWECFYIVIYVYRYAVEKLIQTIAISYWIFMYEKKTVWGFFTDDFK